MVEAVIRSIELVPTSALDSSTAPPWIVPMPLEPGALMTGKPEFTPAAYMFCALLFQTSPDWRNWPARFAPGRGVMPLLNTPVMMPFWPIW